MTCRHLLIESARVVMVWRPCVSPRFAARPVRIQAHGAREGSDCRRTMGPRDRRVEGGGRRSEGTEQGRSAVLARAQPEPGARSAAAVETIRRLERDYPGEPLGEAGAIAAHRDRAAPAAQRCAVVHGGAAASAPAPPHCPQCLPLRYAVHASGARRRRRRRAASDGLARRCRGAGAPAPSPARRAVPALHDASAGMGARRLLPGHGPAHSGARQPDAHGCAEGDPDAEATSRSKAATRRKARRALFVLAQSGRPGSARRR